MLFVTLMQCVRAESDRTAIIDNNIVWLPDPDLRTNYYLNNKSN